MRMVRRVNICVLFFCSAFLLISCFHDESEDKSQDIPDIPNTGATPDTLVQVINQYRQEQGLEPIPVSSSLTLVAETHVSDLENASPAGGECNLHSWSDQGSWSACCYTDDHAQAQCMWDKPDEISGGLYSSAGYEISAYYSGQMTDTIAMEGWKGSPGHHDVILNRGSWTDRTFKAVGAAKSEHYAVVWFGEMSDPAGAP